MIIIQLNLPLQRSIYNESRWNENFFLLFSPLIHLLYQRPFHVLNGSSFPELLSIGKSSTRILDHLSLVYLALLNTITCIIHKKNAWIRTETKPLCCDSRSVKSVCSLEPFHLSKYFMRNQGLTRT